MAWPKGMKRKGYVRKDGQPHLKKGARLTMTSSKASTSTKVSPRTATRSRRTKPNFAATSSQESPNSAPTERQPRRRFTAKLAHPTYSIEQCPNCEFPEADGGYCPECGWSKPVVIGRVY
jgi:hypothetical protein